MKHDRDEVVVRGLSTRPLSVHGADHMECFTTEALLGISEQVGNGCVRMNVEHLSYLPPIGYWHRAEVEDDEDGHSRLVMYGHYLGMRHATDSTLSNESVEGPPAPDKIVDINIGVEPRNFDAEVWQALVDESPLPIHEQAARSLLPPLIWIISVPVTWGVAQFSGGFLKRLGEAAGTRLADWIGSYARRARDSYRDSLVEVQFEVARNLTVSAFIPFTATAHASIEELRNGLDSLGPVARFAGWMTEGDQDRAEVRLVAFFYQDDKWNLGWWATEEEAHVTKWFEENHPDPKKLLGRPHLVIQENDKDADFPSALAVNEEPKTEEGN
jgi:hypothetical protein